jgi:hypothetical protein
MYITGFFRLWRLIYGIRAVNVPLPEVKTIWNRDFVCILIANLMLTLGHFSVNTHVATYATFMGAAPVIMGLLTGMFFGVSLLLKPAAAP